MLEVFGPVRARLREPDFIHGGGFTFPQLPPGTYTLKIGATGFQSYVRSNITLTAGPQPSRTVFAGIVQAPLWPIRLDKISRGR